MYFCQECGVPVTLNHKHCPGEGLQRCRCHLNEDEDPSWQPLDNFDIDFDPERPQPALLAVLETRRPK